MTPRIDRIRWTIAAALGLLLWASGPNLQAAGVGDDPGAETTVSETRDKDLKNTLKWTTASEVENFGFDIYRSDSEDGPFERMTEDPLPGAGTTDEPQHYLWEDHDIEPGKDYFYYIESISMSGVRERFSPIIKAPAK